MKYPKQNARYKTTEINFCLNSISLFSILDKHVFVEGIRTLSNLYSYIGSFDS